MNSQILDSRVVPSTPSSFFDEAAANSDSTPFVRNHEHAPACRFCGASLRQTFVDLGLSPLCQTHIEPTQLNTPELFYPLHVWICGGCDLVQLEEYVAPAEIFSDYAYFSSYSDSWVAHGRKYATVMKQRFALDAGSFVVEIASNDGYLLQHFRADRIPVHGIEPAANVADEAVRKGIPTTVEFFGADTARAFAAAYGCPDLLIGNNVLAHVPDINDFVAGLGILLAPAGVITMEFPHLQRLMADNQFDTIYHEHFSYLSLTVVERIFAAHHLTVFDVEELPTHGGSLRIFAGHADCPGWTPTAAVGAVKEGERAAGLFDPAVHADFAERVHEAKRALLTFLVEARRAGKCVVGYGAPGKGNTLLNYCGIRTDFLDFTVDRNVHKQGRYTPGTRIPIVAPEAIREVKPDYVLILPWNLASEIQAQLTFMRAWGGQCVVPIPTLRILPW